MTHRGVGTMDDTIRILHVDDSPELSELTATWLTRQNERFTIETAATTTEAREHLTAHHVDCIIADYDMPEQNGIQFLEAIRQTYPDLPFILYTGKGSEEIASDAISAGVSDYLQKDTGQDHYTILANRIINLVTQARAEQEVEHTQEYFSRILDHASDYVMIVSETGDVQYISPAVERVLGYSPEDLSGADAFETIHPEDLSLATETFMNLLDDPAEERTVEYRVRHADGSWRWLEVRGRNLLDDSVIDGILVTARDITERKAHERELTTVKRRFEAVLENTTTPMFLKADDGTYIFINREYRDLFGFHDEEVIGRTDQDIHPPEVAAAVQHNDQTVIERGEPIEAEERVPVDDEERIYLTTKAPIYDTGERSDPDDPVGVFGVATDITERKQQSRRLETLISNLPGIVYRARNTPDWPMEVVRGECEELTGYSADALQNGEVIWGEDILHPDDETPIWETVQDAIANDRPFEVTYRIQTKDGTTKWMWERGRVIDSGPPDEIILEGFITDITERKEREQELTRIERRYQAVFDDPNILVGLIDTDGMVLDINQTAMEYIDPTLREVTGQAFWETPWFDHSDAVQAEVQEWIERAAGGEYVEFEADLVRPDGEPYTVEGVFRPVTNDDGEVVSLLISDRDITKRKHREQELERMRDFFQEAEQLGDLGAWEVTATGDVVWTDGTRRIHEVDAAYEPTLEDGIAFYHPEDRGSIEQAVEAALDSGESYDVVARLITAKGNERWIRTRGKPLEDGSVRGFIQDITERKERELELDRQLDLFQKAQDIANVGAWEYDIQRDEAWWSEQVRDIHGLASDVSPSPEVSFEHYHPEDRPRIRTAFKRAIEKGEPYDLELRFIDESGDQKWVRTRGQPQPPDDEAVLVRGTIQDITDRKTQQERLQQLTEQYETVFANAQEAIFLLDVEDGDTFRIAQLNPAEEGLLGYATEEVQGKTLYELYDEETADNATAAYEQCLAAGEPITSTAEYHLEGKARTFETNLAPVRTDGTITQLVGVSREITEAIERKQELSQTNELLSTLLNELPAGVLAETSDRRVAAVNQQLLELFDVAGESASVVDRDCVAFAENTNSMFADPDAFVQTIEERIDRGVVVRRESLELADARVFERSYRPIEFPSGDGHLWLYWDVTGRYRREESLRRFREAVEQAGTAVFITDTEGVIQFVNKEFEDLTGYPSEEAVGEMPTILNSGTHDESYFEELWTTVRAGDIWEDTIVGQRRSGEKYTAVQTVAPITDAEGTITGFVGVQNEITDRLIEQQRLSVLNRMLRHNLRNELAIVMGYVETVMDRHSDEQTHRALATVVKRCRRLLREIKKAQEFQQLLGQDRHDDRSIQTIMETLREVAASFDAAELQVDCEPADEATVLDVVEVALEELVENAFTHGGEDGTVRVAVERSAETQVVFSITDEGPGLPEMEQRVLNGAVEQPLNHSQGFGLWMAYWLVQLAGGSISYDEHEGSGTTIRVRVPLTGDHSG